MRSLMLLSLVAVIACGSNEASTTDTKPSAKPTSPSPSPSPSPTPGPAPSTSSTVAAACQIGVPLDAGGACTVVAMSGDQRLCFASQADACACACAADGKAPRPCSIAESFPPIAVCR